MAAKAVMLTTKTDHISFHEHERGRARLPYLPLSCMQRYASRLFSEHLSLPHVPKQLLHDGKLFK